MSKFFCLAFIFISFTSSFSQNSDSLSNYNLDEITVESGFVIQPKLVNKIGMKAVKVGDVSSVIELAKFMPSIKAQTNSRGESLFYLRGSGERQISLFFDGVPINIPWDNRIDLSLIPSSAMGQVSVTKGVPSISYGANTIAGVVNIDPLSDSFIESNGSANIKLGENNFKQLSAHYFGEGEKFNYFISGDYLKRDGYNLPFSFSNISNPEKERVNSDKQISSLFAKGKYKVNNFSDVSVSVSFVDAEKGVAPETDVKKPRYWRYPLWQKLNFAINGKSQIGKSNSTLLAYTLAYTNFQMKINQYSDISYSEISETEENRDHVLYGRINVSRMLGNESIVKLAVSAFNTKHYEDIAENNTGIWGKQPTQLYEQNVYSVGGEYEYFTDKFSFIFGTGLDGISTLKAGDKQDKGSTNDYSINSSFVYKINSRINTQLNIGRKTRFPTMREAYSGALGRFKVNPNLKAESALNTELNINYEDTNSKLTGAIFLIMAKDGIVRTTLDDGRFMRINKDRVRTYGFEFSGEIGLLKKLNTSLNFAYLNSYAQSTNGSYSDTLEYKPNFIASLNLNYQLSNRLHSALEFSFIGNEYGLKQGSDYFVELPSYLITNIRFSYQFNVNENKIEAYARVNNLFDTLYYTQWSLPEAGRQFYTGVKYNF